MSTGRAVEPSIFDNYVPLNALRPERRGDLAKKSVIRPVRSGDYLFKIGESAKDALFLVAGEVHIEDATGKPIGRLRPGEPAAHHRIAHQSPRKVSARAHGNVEVMVMDAGLLDVMLTWDQTGSFEVGELQSDGGGDNDDWMGKLLQMRTFQMVPPSNLQAMFMRMQEVKMEPGQVVVQQGAEGDFFYAIMTGRCIVTREQPNQKAVKLAELEAGSCFGEEALISDAKRNASVTALTRGSLMRLSKADFRKLLNDPLSRKIGLAEAQKLVDSGKARWLDVRLPSEFQAYSLPGALNMPLYMLRMKLNVVDPKITWIACCDTGRRSSVAVFILTQKGYDAYVLDKGIPPAA